ncbi:transporter [Halobacillus sp. KCTC 3957]|uniref:Transporter n=2 Tax=Halobacillus yeomjeoni TaxID=311194 RepID=A0A931HY16_9BACI|nr:transporter [Halobacillus yeomjeoni]
MGFLSILPPAIAIALAFWTRDTIISLFAACFIGVLLAGKGILGFPELLTNALGNGDFAWIFLLELFIGILIAFFQRTGSMKAFTTYVEKRKLSRKRVQLLTWFMGMFVFYSDYFSSLFVGSTMRGVSDKARISREKLAYITDSTSAPMSILVPITAWGVFVSGLLVGIGPIKDNSEAFSVFIQSIPFNFYAIITIVLVGLIASGIVKDFGPMKKAEKRATEEGKLIRDGAKPLISEELTDIQPYHKNKVLSLKLNFLVPVLIIITIAIGTYIAIDSVKTMEAFLAAVVFLGIVMRLQGIPLPDIMDTALNGIKGVMPAVMILAFAYAINTLSREMGTANYILDVTQSWMTPMLIPLIAFFAAAIVSFATGSSWGTYGILIPIAVPLAVVMAGGDINTSVLATIAAIAGGGVFGDHCSPLSDTTILSSTGAASDHIDHVKTQVPYALVGAGICIILYLFIGFIT